jgi:RHS repeat-associated protein
VGAGEGKGETGGESKAIPRASIFASFVLLIATAKSGNLRFMADRQMKKPLANITTTILSIDMQGSVLRRHSFLPLQSMSYTPFGYSAPETSPRFLLGFNGQLHEHDGIYILGNGYRAYSTKLKRFHSQDSLTSFSSAGLNYYAYSLNDPTNRIDPSGHTPKFIKKIFRTRKTKLMDRLEALSGIESELSPITEALLNAPMQASQEQKSKVLKLVLRAQKKSKGIYKLGGEISPAFDELYNSAKYLTSVWANPEFYRVSTQGAISNQVADFQTRADAPPEYDVVSNNYFDYPVPPPPSYNEAIAKMQSVRS